VYSDSYSMAISDDLLNLAAENTKILVSGGGISTETAASRVVDSLFCPCIRQGVGCGCANVLVSAVLQEVLTRSKAEAGPSRRDARFRGTGLARVAHD